MITQNSFNKKQKAYDPFASNVKLVGDDITEKDYDDFFEGFNDPYGERREQERQRKEQARKEKFANIRANADNRNLYSQSVSSSQTNSSLPGSDHNANEQNKWMRTVNTVGRISRAYEDFEDKISPYVKKVSLVSPAAPVHIATDVAEALLKNAHYSRNDKNVSAPQTIGEAKDMGWQEEDQNYCHQFDTPNMSNVKYVPTDGGGEQIFGSKGNVVTTPENMATYNLFHPEKEKFMHLLADVAPWVLWGNSPDDSTAKLERIVTPLVLKYYKENVLNRNGNSSGVSDK